jgi:hypothetical protein
MIECAIAALDCVMFRDSLIIKQDAASVDVNLPPLAISR